MTTGDNDTNTNNNDQLMQLYPIDSNWNGPSPSMEMNEQTLHSNALDWIKCWVSVPEAKFQLVAVIIYVKFIFYTLCSVIM